MKGINRDSSEVRHPVPVELRIRVLEGERGKKDQKVGWNVERSSNRNVPLYLRAYRALTKIELQSHLSLLSVHERGGGRTVHPVCRVRGGYKRVSSRSKGPGSRLCNAQSLSSAFDTPAGKNDGFRPGCQNRPPHMGLARTRAHDDIWYS